MIKKIFEERRKYQMDKEENEIIQHHDFVARMICLLAIGQAEEIYCYYYFLIHAITLI